MWSELVHLTNLIKILYLQLKVLFLRSDHTSNCYCLKYCVCEVFKIFPYHSSTAIWTHEMMKWWHSIKTKTKWKQEFVISKRKRVLRNICVCPSKTMESTYRGGEKKKIFLSHGMIYDGSIWNSNKMAKREQMKCNSTSHLTITLSLSHCNTTSVNYWRW